MRVIFGEGLRRYAYVGDEVSCLYLQNAAPDAPLIVTFDYWRRSRDDIEIYAETFCRKHGFNQFHVVPTSNNWFQTQEMERAVEAFDRTRHEGARVVTYGASMGGFAALQFAKRLHADTVIAFSPQVQIDPTKPPFDKRWQETEMLNFLYNNIDLSDARRVFTVYDPLCRKDRQHLRLLPKNAPLTRIPIIGAGHSPDAALNEWRLLDAFILSLISGTYRHRTLRSNIPVRKRLKYCFQNIMNYYSARLRARLQNLAMFR